MHKKAFFICAASSLILFVGCGAKEQIQAKTDLAQPASSEVEDHDHDNDGEHLSHGVEFKEGRGLTIPPITSKTLGLKIVDVEEGKATRRIELALRVFDIERSSKDVSALASCSVDTNSVRFLQRGTSVTMKSAEAAPLHGKVIKVASASAKVTGLAEVIVRFPVQENVKVGTFLDGTVTVTTEQNVVVIAKDAVLKTAEGYFAYVVNGDSLFRTKIGVGGQEGEVVEVTDGLYAGDRVVLQPIMPLWLAELQAIRGGKACADGH